MYLCVVGGGFVGMDFWNVTKYGSSLILAVCLDGSPPAYHLHWGSGSGANSWLVHLEASHFSSSFIFIYSPRLPFILILILCVMVAFSLIVLFLHKLNITIISNK